MIVPYEVFCNNIDTLHQFFTSIHVICLRTQQVRVRKSVENAKKKNGEKRNRRNGGRKRKEKRAQGDLLLMKNKYTTHADEPFPFFLFDQFLLSPYRFLETLSFFYPILSNAHIYVYAYTCIYMYTYMRPYNGSSEHSLLSLFCIYPVFASTLARVNVQIIK